MYKNIKTPKIILICSDAFLKKLALKKDKSIKIFGSSKISSKKVWEEIKKDLQKGSDLIFIGTKNKDKLKELWIANYSTGDFTPSFTNSNYKLQALENSNFQKGSCHCCYIQDPHIHEYPKPGVTGETTGGFLRTNSYHGVDEEIRANFYPIIEAKDSFGKTLGYPGILLEHYAGALTSNNYKNARWFIFLLDKPEEIIPIDVWQSTIKEISEKFKQGLFISKLKTNYASYDLNENVNIKCEVRNKYQISSIILKFKFFDEKMKLIKELYPLSRNINTADSAILEANFTIDDNKSSYYTIKASLFSKEKEIFIDQKECQVVINNPQITLNGAKIEINESEISFDDNNGFFVGTHYCGTSDYYAWMWRDFKSEIVRRDLKALKSDGIKLIRIYIPPHLDEQTLRAMDAFIQICQEFKMIVDIVLFSQWPATLRINIDNINESFEFRTPEDYDIIGLSFQNIQFQRKYVTTIVKRYKNTPGIIWNITNELALLNYANKIPENSTWIKPEYKSLATPYDAINLCNQWLNEIKKTIKNTGALQPIISTYNYTWANGDSYFTNQIGELGTYHDYSSNLNYCMTQDLTSSKKPLFLEEFGINTLDNDERLAHYDSILHYSLGLNLSGACSYEYGVSWMAPELPYLSNHIKHYASIKSKLNLWAGLPSNFPKESLGMCSYAASFLFGMAYHCTGISGKSAQLMKKIAWIGRQLSYKAKGKEICLIPPMEFTEVLVEAKGHKRMTELIENTIKELQKEHIEYSITQEDDISNIPNETKIILYPNELAIKKSIEKKLTALEEKGIKVYRKNNLKWKKLILSNKVKISPKKNISLLTRDIESGTLYVLHNKSTITKNISIYTNANNKVELTIKTFAMIAEQSNKITLIESNGITILNNTKLINSHGKRYIIHSLDKKNILIESQQNILIPFEVAKINILHKKDLSLIDIDNNEEKNIRKKIPFQIKENMAILDINDELINYAFKLY